MSLHIEDHILKEKTIIFIAIYFHIPDVLFPVRCHAELLIISQDKIELFVFTQHQEVYTLAQGFLSIKEKFSLAVDLCRIFQVSGISIKMSEMYNSILKTCHIKLDMITRLSRTQRGKHNT